MQACQAVQAMREDGGPQRKRDRRFSRLWNKLRHWSPWHAQAARRELGITDHLEAP
jgi:hypothetical protein